MRFSSLFLNIKAPGGAFAVLAALMVLLGVPSTGLAGALQVSPIRIEIPATQQSSSLWLSNNSETVIQAEVEIQRWTQDNGQDVLSPTQDLAATPAIISIAPGQRQLVRIVRMGTHPSQETAYRIIARELPGTQREPSSTGLNILFSYSIPVFLTPGSEKTTPVLAGQVREGHLWVENTGGGRAMLSDLYGLDAQGQATLLRPGLVGYVLPGHQMRFPLNSPGPVHAVKVTVNQDGTETWSTAP